MRALPSPAGAMSRAKEKAPSPLGLGAHRIFLAAYAFLNYFSILGNFL
ncbi:protein of unknown function [Azospirillum lipoferum 4B]|uniref:Uncharacterized protein n=1 Tax=Azospirillum lipoferum (strain 4B) TaxID=862719 RepID=G7Z8S7_AZOL4|nr:protein of unknown function [Azospirillum lipoferum 4B]